jgi:hypothetical protein
MTVAKLVENAARQLACEHRGLKKLAEGAAPLSFEISRVPTYTGSNYRSRFVDKTLVLSLLSCEQIALKEDYGSELSASFDVFL